MEFFEWTEDLETGIDIIDEQHKRIVLYINNLYDASHSGNTKVVGEVIDELVDYTISHFAFEESLMEKADYAFLEPHKKVHELFVKKVNQFVERFAKGEDVSGELLRMLQRWLLNHIKHEDADYSVAVKRSMALMKKEETGGWLSGALKKFFH